jgi:hypothetical protein
MDGNERRSRGDEARDGTAEAAERRAGQLARGLAHLGLRAADQREDRALEVTMPIRPYGLSLTGWMTLPPCSTAAATAASVSSTAK